VTTVTRIPRVNLLIGISIVIVIAMLFANGVIAASADDEQSFGQFVGFSVFGIAVSAVLLLYAVPRLPDEHRPTAVLGFGIAAIVLLVAFWSTLPFALGIAAIAAGSPGDDSAHGDEPAPVTAGVLLGVLAIVAGFILCLIG
jgi:hypothetical protein